MVKENESVIPKIAHKGNISKHKPGKKRKLKESTRSNSKKNTKAQRVEEEKLFTKLQGITFLSFPSRQISTSWDDSVYYEFTYNSRKYKPLLGEPPTFYVPPETTRDVEAQDER